jgi:hypothetical protein
MSIILNSNFMEKGSSPAAERWKRNPFNAHGFHIFGHDTLPENCSFLLHFTTLTLLACLIKN